MLLVYNEHKALSSTQNLPAVCPFDFFHSPHLFISVHSETPCSLCLLFNIFICYFCFGAFLQHTVSLSFSDSISLQFSPLFFHFFNFFFLLIPLVVLTKSTEGRVPSQQFSPGKTVAITVEGHSVSQSMICRMMPWICSSEGTWRPVVLEGGYKNEQPERAAKGNQW